MTFSEDELDEFLVDKLNLIKRTTPRDPKIARKRRDEYMKKANNQQFNKPMFSIARLFNRKPKQTSINQRRSLVPFAAAILLIFGLVFGGWGTVYAAQDSQPDEFLYPVKLVVEYLEDFDTVTEDTTRTTKRAGDLDHLWTRDQDRTKIDPDQETPMHQYGIDKTWEDRGHYGGNDPIPPIEDPIDETVTPRPVISGTQTISRTQSGYLYGPGAVCFEEEPGECGPFGPIGYTYGLDTEDPPQFKGDLPETDEDDLDPPLGWGPGPGEDDDPQQPLKPPQSEDNQKPEEPPVQNKDGGDTKGGKP